MSHSSYDHGHPSSTRGRGRLSLLLWRLRRLLGRTGRRPEVKRDVCSRSVASSSQLSPRSGGGVIGCHGDRLLDGRGGKWRLLLLVISVVTCG